MRENDHIDTDILVMLQPELLSRLYCYTKTMHTLDHCCGIKQDDAANIAYLSLENKERIIIQFMQMMSDVVKQQILDVSISML